MTARNDTRYQYGYARAETDAVLAAFSHDNTTFATNYRQHTVAVDFVATTNLHLNATWYLYRRDTGPDNDFISRIRLNAMVIF
jgi:hypothetical protein